MASAHGTRQIAGQTAYLEGLVVVPRGQSEGAAKDRALKSQGASFRFVNGGTTGTCPSLVPGCAGGQRFDGENGVGWAALEDGTLGVTVYNPSIDEADMGINNRYPWNLGCQELPTSTRPADRDPARERARRRARPLLGQDDINGIRAIYP